MPDKTDTRREAMANIIAPENEALWYSRGKIHEVMFCEYLLRKHPLRCIRNRLYDVNGFVSDDRISREIMQEIKLYCNTEVAKQVNNLVKAVKLMAPDDEIPPREDRIHFANGTLFLDGGFTPDKEFCMNRLPVSYTPDAPAPRTWLAFLNSLLHEEDIPTLQEFMGYTLVPTNKAQKMLILVGNGGEGKSRVTIVMRAIHGENMNICSLQKLASDRFCRADQEAKLLMRHLVKISILPRWSAKPT